MLNKGVFLAGFALAAMSGAASAQTFPTLRCDLTPIQSVDAIQATVTYFRDTDILHAVLTSFHQYDDGSTLITTAPTFCFQGDPTDCRSRVVEGIFPGDEATYWQTEIVRQGEQITVTNSGFTDPGMTQGFADNIYTDVFRIVSCSGDDVFATPAAPATPAGGGSK